MAVYSDNADQFRIIVANSANPSLPHRNRAVAGDLARYGFMWVLYPQDDKLYFGQWLHANEGIVLNHSKKRYRWVPRGKRIRNGILRICTWLVSRFKVWVLNYNLDVVPLKALW